MCGIFLHLLKSEIVGSLQSVENQRWLLECHQRASKIRPRGPEKSKYKRVNQNLYMSFQRLAINDLSEKGDQPMEDPSERAVLMCNGEIYNTNDLIQRYQLPVQGHSDCEVILYLYLKFGLNRTLEELDGEFAFAIYDRMSNQIMVARDPYGVRPLFLLENEKEIMISSEVKAFYGKEGVVPVPNGTFWTSRHSRFTPYLDRPKNKEGSKPANGSAYLSAYHSYLKLPLNDLQENIRTTLTEAVKKRLHSDRKIGCLLSGGLDSSLVTALVCRLSGTPENITTYSIGMSGSTDLAAARKVAKFLGTDHHEIVFTEETAIQAITPVINALESWDTTTIRASIGMYLLAQYIKQKTPHVKVILSGEGADEVCQGYLYFHLQPSPNDGHKESVRLLQELIYFDVLRADRCISAHGLELRVPFLDKKFVDLYLSIAPVLRSPDKKKGEKWLLREAFSGENLLPTEILWRRKDGFSDGCSSLERPLYKVLEDHAEREISDELFVQREVMFPHCPPKTKEAFLFRTIFHEHYPEKGRAELIPFQWLPRWMGDVTNPSGRVVPVFHEEIEV